MFQEVTITRLYPPTKTSITGLWEIGTGVLTNCMCNGAEWSKDKTQAAESIKWRPQQAYGSNHVLLVQPQTVFSTHKIITLTHR